MPATESKVAGQPWNKNRECDTKERATQYKTKEDTDKLVRKGYLREVPIEKRE